MSRQFWAHDFFFFFLTCCHCFPFLRRSFCRLRRVILCPNLVSGMKNILLQLKGSQWSSTGHELIVRKKEELQQIWSCQEESRLACIPLSSSLLRYVMVHSHTFAKPLRFVVAERMALALALLLLVAFFVTLNEQNSAVCGGFLSAEIDWCCRCSFLCICFGKILMAFPTVHYDKLLGLPPPVLKTLFMEWKCWVGSLLCSKFWTWGLLG